ncbi:kinase-like domain-containing protein [Cristinia sonorae]|uniref:Kinase-like domain-containing protein n=1 Tax=Cristinia sonorae TaxID=1940300 RepID=A0A8K0UEH9_9AGAR|nr:kinase-like domain-containing protein [Cristinia sonorae]
MLSSAWKSFKTAKWGIPQSNTLADSALYTHTSGRWLCNEKTHMALREVRFNVAALKRAVARSVHANSIISMVKIGENFNRAFLCTCDNGREVIARLPTQLSGPPYFTTASEVATMDFLRRLGIPVPRVLAWNSRADDSAVGAEYIIMEKAEGRILQTIPQSHERRRELTLALSKVLRPLSQLQFKYHGSIYYKGDLPQSLVTQADFLLEPPTGVDISPFVMGPSAGREWWEAERATLDIHRGPWPSAHKYFSNAATREQLWIMNHAKPSLYDDYLCVLPLQGKYDEHVEMLNIYKEVLNFILLLGMSPHHTTGRIWHPDLHDSNIFVDNSQDGSVKITSIIDWQGACASPAFVQLAVPEIFSFPAATLETGESGRREDRTLHSDFERLTFPEMLDIPWRALRAEICDWAGTTWKTGLLPLKNSLMTLQKQWPKIAPDYRCPITFTEEECMKIENALATYWDRRRLYLSLNEELGLDEYGYVDFKGDELRGQKEFRRIQKVLEEKRLEHMSRRADHVDGDVIRALQWPFRDTLADDPRSHMKAV